MKINHYSIFDVDIDNLLTPTSWEKLRESPAAQAYYIPQRIEDYQEKFALTSPNPLAKAIIDTAKSLGYNKVFSPGCGTAHLEYQIKQHSNLEVVIADYNDSILILKKFGIFDDCLKMDLLKDELTVQKEYFFLMPRIDTEFTDEELSKVIEKIYDSGVKHIFFIPAQLLTLKIILVEFKIIMKAFFTNKKRTFCGYSRTKNHFIKLFRPFYKSKPMKIGDKVVFLFEKKNK